MTATEDTATGTIVRWSLGDENPWGKLYVDLGIIRAEISMSSREARALALDVLSSQGPYLGFQPPNERMRERSRVEPFSTPVKDGVRPRWRLRRDVENAVHAVDEIRDRFGDEVLAWALQEVTTR